MLPSAVSDDERYGERRGDDFFLTTAVAVNTIPESSRSRRDGKDDDVTQNEVSNGLQCVEEKKKEDCERAPLLVSSSSLPAPPSPSSSSSASGAMSLPDSDPGSWLFVIGALAELTLPMSVTFIGYFSITIVGQLYAAMFSVSVVAGYGLATMVVNSFAFAVVTGLCGGLDTLISQAYGKSPTHPMISIFAQRGTLCFLVLSIPICVLFYFAHDWMSAFHFADPQVVDVAAHLLQLLIVVVPIWVLSEVLGTTLTAINQTLELFVGVVPPSMLHPVVLYLLLHVFHVGYEGLAISFAITITLMFTLTCLTATFYTKSILSTFHGWNLRQSLKHWGPLLKLSIPAMGIMMCEWAAFEINLMLSARYLPQEDFAAVVICQQLYCALLPIPVALGYAASIKVGNFVGAKHPRTAERTAVVTVLLTLAMSAAFGGVLVGARGPLSSLFSSHPRVQAIAEDTLPAVAVMFFFDVLLGSLTSTLRGVGEQRRAALVTIIGWWCIGIPCGLIFHYSSLGATLGARGFFFGPAIGLSVACLAAGWLVMFKISYDESDHIAEHFALTSDESSSIVGGVEEED